MKIDNSAKTIGTVPGPSVARTPVTRSAATGVKTGVAAAGASTTVVSTALYAASGAEGTFDVQKVAEIRQAIRDGRFQINPERIADGLINSVRDMMLGQDRRSS